MTFARVFPCVCTGEYTPSDQKGHVSATCVSRKCHESSESALPKAKPVFCTFWWPMSSVHLQLLYGPQPAAESKRHIWCQSANQSESTSMSGITRGGSAATTERRNGSFHNGGVSSLHAHCYVLEDLTFKEELHCNVMRTFCGTMACGCSNALSTQSQQCDNTQDFFGHSNTIVAPSLP